MTFTDWLDHFRSNETHLDHIDWRACDHVDEREKAIIRASIQQFQKGENSEGRQLMAFAKKDGAKDHQEAVRYFIREEQRHSMALGTFMERNGIPRIKEHWVDTVFRRLRKLTGLENSVRVLLTAEIIAMVYYVALRDATASRTLKAICQQILEDEELHINFQSFTLHRYYHHKSRIRRFLVRNGHRILMTGTFFVVWLHHRSVLKAGGYGFKRFYRELFREFERSERMIRGLDRIEVKKAAA
ncbi:MAG: ferritin-like domain-containing protein [Flavobacteriales bacterium]